MNPPDSSIIPSDSSINPPDSSINPSDSSINPPENTTSAVPLIPIHRKTLPPSNTVENQQLINVIDESNLIEVRVDDVIDVLDDLPEDKDKDDAVKEIDVSMRSPRPTLYEHTETPGGSIYWEPHVDEGIPVPVEGKYYDTIDMYSNYAEAGGFQIKKAGQRLTKSGIVQLKYIMCNKEGAPRHINVDTLDSKHSDKQKRNTTMHVTGCKARISLELDVVSGKYKLVQFIAKHNHLLIPKEYKHFTKKQRRMTQAEKMFVVKATKNKIGPTRAHNLLTSMKGGHEYVHGTVDDFKNEQRGINMFIGESDAQMLINKMENRKIYVPNFTQHGILYESHVIH